MKQDTIVCFQSQSIHGCSRTSLANSVIFIHLILGYFYVDFFVIGSSLVALLAITHKNIQVYTRVILL